METKFCLHRPQSMTHLQVERALVARYGGSGTTRRRRGAVMTTTPDVHRLSFPPSSTSLYSACLPRTYRRPFHISHPEEPWTPPRRRRGALQRAPPVSVRPRASRPGPHAPRVPSTRADRRSRHRCCRVKTAVIMASKIWRSRRPRPRRYYDH